MEMTITRALNDIKMLDKRINKAIMNGTFISVSIKDTVDKKEIKANYQSVIDLISHRNKLKAAVLASNAVTRIVVNNEEMTVSEAIERKKSINYLIELRDELRRQLVSMTKLADAHNARQEENLNALLEANFSRDSKPRIEDFAEITDKFWEKNKAELIDPLNILKTIQKLDDEITSFENEVDLVLSESNATTKIQLD